MLCAFAWYPHDRKDLPGISCGNLTIASITGPGFVGTERASAALVELVIPVAHLLKNLERRYQLGITAWLYLRCNVVSRAFE